VSLVVPAGEEVAELQEDHPVCLEVELRALERYVEVALQSLPEPNRQVVLLLKEGNLAIAHKAAGLAFRRVKCRRSSNRRCKR